MIKVLHFVSKMDRAGQETFIMNVYRQLDREKIQFSFLCSRHEPADYDEEIRSLGGEIYYLPQNQKTGRFSRYFGKIQVLMDWLRKNRDCFDIVHLHTYHALDVWTHLEACRRAGVSRVVIHSHGTDGPHYAVHKLMRFINRFYRCRRLACSQAAGEWLHGKNADFTVIYNGIDVEAYRYNPETAAAYKKELGLEGKTVLGHIGRFNYQKNHGFLLEVFAAYRRRTPDSVLLLIGRGELEMQVGEKVASLQLEGSVRFLGVRDDVAKLLNCMDAFVFPSHHEGLGIVLVEAQVNGLPVLASDNTMKEAIVSDSVQLLPTHNPEKWADVLCCVVGNRTDNIKAEKFESKGVVDCLTKVYQNL